MNYIDITQSTQTLNVNLNTSENTEVVVSESGELVSNGLFNADTDWTKSGNVVISSGKAVFNNTSLALLYQDITGAVQSATYKVTYTISEYISGSISFGFGNGLQQPQGTVRNANSTYTEYITKTDAFISAGFRTNAFVGSIDNVSVKEIIEGTNNVSVNLSVYADGSDTLILNFDSSITSHNYYQTIGIGSTELAQLKDETQYNIVGVDSNNKVIYRGKFQTTSKDLNNLSVNEGQYIKKTTATNYTILD